MGRGKKPTSSTGKGNIVLTALKLMGGGEDFYLPPVKNTVVPFASKKQDRQVNSECVDAQPFTLSVISKKVTASDRAALERFARLA